MPRTREWVVEHPEEMRAYRRKHYHNNKEQYYRRNKENKERLIELINKHKDRPCMDCGVSYPPYVMDLDHRDPSTKVDAVSSLKNRGSRTLVEAEIAKCDVVCANCHRIRTHRPLA